MYASYCGGKKVAKTRLSKSLKIRRQEWKVAYDGDTDVLRAIADFADTAEADIERTPLRCQFCRETYTA